MDFYTTLYAFVVLLYTILVFYLTLTLAHRNRSIFRHFNLISTSVQTVQTGQFYQEELDNIWTEATNIQHTKRLQLIRRSHRRRHSLTDLRKTPLPHQDTPTGFQVSNILTNRSLRTAAESYVKVAQDNRHAIQEFHGQLLDFKAIYNNVITALTATFKDQQKVLDVQGKTLRLLESQINKKIPVKDEEIQTTPDERLRVSGRARFRTRIRSTSPHRRPRSISPFNTPHDNPLDTVAYSTNQPPALLDDHHTDDSYQQNISDFTSTRKYHEQSILICDKNKGRGATLGIGRGLLRKPNTLPKVLTFHTQPPPLDSSPDISPPYTPKTEDEQFQDFDPVDTPTNSTPWDHLPYGRKTKSQASFKFHRMKDAYRKLMLEQGLATKDNISDKIKELLD